MRGALFRDLCDKLPIDSKIIIDNYNTYKSVFYMYNSCLINSDLYEWFIILFQRLGRANKMINENLTKLRLDSIVE